MKNSIAKFTLSGLAAIIFVALIQNRADAQNVNVSTPFTTTTDSYFENHGFNFGFSIPGGRGPGSRVVGFSRNGVTPNINFNYGGSQSVIPAFGGYNPNSIGRIGFGRQGANGGGFSLGLSLGKGNTRSNFSTTPNLTVQNGYGGNIFSGSVRPYVTGVIPIVGGAAGGQGFSTPAIPVSGIGNIGSGGGTIVRPVDNAVTRAINSGQLNLGGPASDPEPSTSSATVTYSNAKSSATRGDSSVAAIKSDRERRVAVQRLKLKQKLAEAQTLADEGDVSSARTTFREALQLTDDEKVKLEIKARIAATRK